MNKLYPLKFKPILKDKIWGGSKLKNVLNKSKASDKAGESWEISGVQGEISVVSNGFLKGNNLQELVEIYMGDLVGEKVYQKFGIEFPLLIKFIDACDVLSIQVHPDDKMAKDRHNSYGKTEMWVVLEAEKDAEIIVGFKNDTEKEIYLQHLEENTLTSILNSEKANPGDVFFLPAGRVHAIGKGILLAEIQQTSDVTYRIYDFDRKDDEGNTRELHTELALDAIDYTSEEEYKTIYKKELNKSVNLEDCSYFTANMLEIDKPKTMDYSQLESFVIFMCLEGKMKIAFEENESIELVKGETVLIPADLEIITLEPELPSNLLEVYIKN